MPDWATVAIRTLAAVIVLFILTKILGKRQISQLSTFEYITGITIGSLAAYVSLDMEAEWYLGIVALSVWVFVSFVIEFAQIKSKRLRDWVDGNGTVLIKEGKILEDNLKKERITNEELLTQLRKKNAFRIADVEFAIMEPNGEINVMLTAENQPLTPKNLGMKMPNEPAPQAIILDGVIMDEPLATLGFSREWLLTELDKLGLDITNIYIGQANTFGELYVDTYDDQLQLPVPSTRASLLATLKKCEADLEMFGLSTRDPKVKAMYEQSSEALQRMIQEVRPYLTES
jgi:uncharacterized membrane protein YcaP (DUF421 family)